MVKKFDENWPSAKIEVRPQRPQPELQTTQGFDALTTHEDCCLCRVVN
jgi:hypothetical protein